MRLLLTTLTFLIVVTGNAQNFSKSLQSLVAAELAFAEMARTKNTKEAFLHFMNENGLVFSQGQALNARQSWKWRDTPKSLLQWEPVYADISASGDFGYTTGPFKLYATRTDTVASAFGYYSTMWSREKNGEWRALADIGVAFATEEKTIPKLTTSAKRTVRSSTKQSTALNSMLAFDGDYIALLNNSERSFDARFFSEEGRIHRFGVHPVKSMPNIRNYGEDHQAFRFEQSGGYVARSGDLGYSYGSVWIESQDQPALSASYLHVWKKESDSWKLVLDVISL